MAKRRSPEELHEIYLKCAEILHTDGEKAVVEYLETENYLSANATWFNIQRSADWKIAQQEYKAGRRSNRHSAESTEKEPEQKVVLNGVEYTPYVNGDLPADKKEPKETRETEGYADGMVYTKAEPVNENAEEKVCPADVAEPEPIEVPSFLDAVLMKNEQKQEEMIMAEEEKKAEEAKQAEDEKQEKKQEKKPEENTMKPPLGLMPAWLWKKERVNNILAAMMRYSLAGYYTPIEWITELAELVGANMDVVMAAVDNILSREAELNG